MLNAIFGRADECAGRHGVEKVKTIGDAYLAVSGGNSSAECQPCDAVRFGVDLIREVEDFAREAQIDLKVRIGIHTGPVVGGVIGNQRMAYDYWGDTMNIASRIEGIAHANGIAVSEATFYSSNHTVAYAQPELATLKGVGDMKVYRVTGLL